MTKQTAVLPAMPAQIDSSSVDWLIADIAGHQHGVVSRQGLLEAGVSRYAIDHRLATGRLHRLHRGVYAIGHRIVGPDGFRIAAVLAGGAGAVLSHRAAAAHLGLRPSERLDVTLGQGRRQIPGISVHYLPLPVDEITTVRGIRVTTVPRTLFDLAAVLPRHQVERAINQAEFLRITDPLSLEDLVERYTKRRGVPVVRAIVAAMRAGPQFTRSDLEALFLAFLDRVGLPRPETNVQLLVAGRWIECDCLWREKRIIVELDSRAAHNTTAAFERDRARDRALAARGWRHVRITWRHLTEEPEAVASDLRAILEAQLPISSAIAA